MIWIYEIRNIKKNVVYYGQTINPRKRWETHRRSLNNGCHHDDYLQNAWNKYGNACFVFSLLCQVSTVNEANTMEGELIKEAKTAGYCYNLRDGGNNAPRSEESKRRQQAVMKGRHPWNKGLQGVYSRETIEKMRTARANQTFTPEMEERRIRNMKGVRRSEAYRNYRKKVMLRDNPMSNPKYRAKKSLQLSPEVISQIRQLRSDGKTYEELVEQFKISQTSIARIVKNQGYYAQVAS